MAKTSLSAGEIIRSMLLGSDAVSAITTRIFPVATDKAELPYVAYRRSKHEQQPSKAGYAGADTVQIEVNCYSAGYAEGLALAEAVREALDCQSAETESLRMRSCVLADSEEYWADGADAYVQNLVFNIKI